MQYDALHGAIWLKGTFWVTVAVLIFLGFFGRKLLSGIIDVLDRRTRTIQRELDEALRLRAEAEAMLKDAEAMRLAAMAQAADMIALAGREAERLAAELHAATQFAAQRREKMVQQRIVAAEAAAVAHVRDHAANLAASLTESVLARTFDEHRDSVMIDKAIQDLPSVFRSQVS